MKDSSKLIIFLVIFIHFLCMPRMINSESSCNTTVSCKSNRKHDQYAIPIKYPFRLEDQQPKSCGSPGFNLHCYDDDDNNNEDDMGPFLSLPDAGTFSVEFINYTSRRIELSDPNDCLPQKLLSLNLTKSPFKGVNQSKDFWVYNCSIMFAHHHNEIVCLRGSDYTIVSGSEGEIDTDNSNCTLLKIVSVPTVHKLRRLTSYTSIHLTWDNRDCDQCETMPKTSESANIVSAPRSINPYRMMVAVISTFVVLILICILFTLCLCMSKYDRVQQAAATRATTTNENNHTLNVDNNTEISTPSDDVGLDHVTINSYPMVVVGSSGRLIKLSDNKCSICLSDYFPGDTLIILPECLHRFHVDCIRSWLSSKPTCPICRTSPRNS